MRQLNLETVRKGLLVLMLALFSISVPAALAQTSTTTTQGSGGGAAAQQQSSQRETTTTTTRTQTATGIDPLWLVLGGIALLAILLIVILAARGRSGSDTTHVRERTTVIKD
ncbi:MAG TPA: hypothetical protein VF779_10055 [Pyrinomonadaceae bacterium]